jgi:hypothetical protein
MRKRNKHIGLEGLGTEECDLKKVEMSRILKRIFSLVLFI